MAIRLNDTIKLPQSARLLLIAMAWRAEDDGALAPSLSIASCGRDVDVRNGSLTNAKKKLFEHNLIFDMGSTRGVLVSSLQALYEQEIRKRKQRKRSSWRGTAQKVRKEQA
jgi:hypothetical protein